MSKDRDMSPDAICERVLKIGERLKAALNADDDLGEISTAALILSVKTYVYTHGIRDPIEYEAAITAICTIASTTMREGIEDIKKEIAADWMQKKPHPFVKPGNPTVN
jgi:hypothetical protein